MPEPVASGPLAGVVVIEFAAMGPAPFCAMFLADLGATVIRVDRAPGGHQFVKPELALINRGKQSIVLDLKSDAGREVALRLVGAADALIEGYRPGVTERMGLGPKDCLERNGRLVYGRMTGWGQHGPFAQRAGHDINYTAVSGALYGIGPVERPYPALNLLGDFGGGGMLLAAGLLAALLSARTSGKGQVIDAAMIDGVSLLTTGLYGLLAADAWHSPRQSNMFDGSRPYYTTYRTSDGRHLSVGALEPQFWSEFLRVIGLDSVIEAGDQEDATTWERTRALVSARVAERPCADWEGAFAGRDCCVSPVLSLLEARDYEHNRARDSYVEIAGVRQPKPAPRFGSTPTAVPSPPPRPGANTRAVLATLGYRQADIESMIIAGAAAD